MESMASFEAAVMAILHRAKVVCYLTFSILREGGLSAQKEPGTGLKNHNVGPWLLTVLTLSTASPEYPRREKQL